MQHAERGEVYQVIAKVKNNNPTPQTVTIDWSEHYISAPHPIENPASGQLGPIQLNGLEEVRIPLGAFSHTWQWIPTKYPFSDQVGTLKDMLASIAFEHLSRKKLLDKVVNEVVPLIQALETLLTEGYAAERTTRVDYTAIVRWGAGPSVVQRETLEIEVPQRLQIRLAAIAGLDLTASALLDAGIGFAFSGQVLPALASFGAGLGTLAVAEAQYGRLLAMS